MEQNRAEELIALIDARIDEKIGNAMAVMAGDIDTNIVGPFTENLEAMWGQIAELVAREVFGVGDAYRRFVVGEAKRLGVRPGEVAQKKRENIEQYFDELDRAEDVGADGDAGIAG